MLSFLFSEKFFITVLLIIAVVLILFVLIKYKHARPILIVILCVAWLGCGLYSGFTWYTFNKTNNVTIGEPEIHNPYEDFDFYKYNLDNIVWYQQEDGTYKYEITYATTTKFDGEKSFQLIVNNAPCKETAATNGRLHGVFEKQFIDIDGQVVAEIEFKIDFAFYASKITLTVENNASVESIGLVREYVNVNGFKLRIINSVYGT